MQSIIIYYSFSGNTKKVAEVLAEYLKEKGEVDIISLNSIDESANFFGQAKRAFRRVRAKIAPVNSNLGHYDIICMGTPVWAFGPAPAMNTYLDICIGTEGKEAILFTTYGSGTGNKRCLNYMQDTLLKKGVRQCRRFSIQQNKVNNRAFILSKLKIWSSNS